MKILFLGGDTRYKYMMKDLCNKHQIFQIGFSDLEDNINKEKLENINLAKYDIVLFPISGVGNNMEIKAETGIITLPDNIFNNLSNNTTFFTGLKTDKLLELIPNDRLISFLDFEEVETVNNELTIEGTLADISDKKADSVCVIRLWKTWQRIILETN